MTNVLGQPGKMDRMRRLFQTGVTALEEKGWKVERIPGAGKSSIRKITKDGQSKVACLRTTQDTWFAFARDAADSKWVTLEDAAVVVVVSVDDRFNPQYAQVHMLDAADVRDRFDRGYAARKAEGHVIPIGRGMWMSLYEKEDTTQARLVGAGMGLKNPPIARVPLTPADIVDEAETEEELEEPAEVAAVAAPAKAEEAPLTIPEAKRRLALTLGVEPANIKITVVDA